jgi:hypothetical protein
MSRTITLAFDHGGNGGIIGIDGFKMTQFLALSQVFRLLADLFMMTHRRGSQPWCISQLVAGRAVHCGNANGRERIWRLDIAA